MAGVMQLLGKRTKIPPMRTPQLRAGIAGLTFAILYLFANSALASIPLAPTGTDTGEEIARYFDRNSATVLILDLVLVVSLGFLVWFAYAFRATLVSVKGARGRSPEVLVAASIAAATVVVCATALAPLTGLKSLTPIEARTVWDLGTTLSVLFVLPLALITAAIAISTRGSAFPKWVWVTSVALIPVLLFVFVAWLSIKLWCLWIAALSISLLRGRRWNRELTGST